MICSLIARGTRGRFSDVLLNMLYFFLIQDLNLLLQFCRLTRISPLVSYPMVDETEAHTQYHYLSGGKKIAHE